MKAPITQFVDRPLAGTSFAASGLVATRNRAGTLQTNIIHRVIHHSPTGFNIGGLGSGCADLSLNTLEQFLRYKRYEGPRQKCFDGDCFELAWRMHQPFKEGFIARSDREVVVSMRTIRLWVAAWCKDNSVPWEEPMFEQLDRKPEERP